MSLSQGPSYRQTALALTVAALAAVPGLAGKASAQPAAPAGGSVACAPYARDASAKGFHNEVQCEINQIHRRIQDVKQQGVEADKRGVEADKRGAEADKRKAEAERQGVVADQVSDCTDFIISGVKGGRFAKTAVLLAAKGKLSSDNACPVARSFGFGQKAELDQPKIR